MSAEIPSGSELHSSPEHLLLSTIETAYRSQPRVFATRFDRDRWGNTQSIRTQLEHVDGDIFSLFCATRSFEGGPRVTEINLLYASKVLYRLDVVSYPTSRDPMRMLLSYRNPHRSCILVHRRDEPMLFISDWHETRLTTAEVNDVYLDSVLVLPKYLAQEWVPAIPGSSFSV